MEYEAYEPDPDDEYYDQLCTFMYEKMFNYVTVPNENSSDGD